MTKDETTTRTAGPRVVGEALWPTMLRAPGLALRPERVGLMFLAVTASAVVASIPLPWEGSASLAEVWRSAGAWEAGGAGWGAGCPWVSAGRTLAAVARGHAWALVGPGLAIAAVMVLACAAVSRMCAMEFALGTFMTLGQGVRFAASRAGSLAAAFALPAVLVLGAWVVMAAGGAVLLRVTGVDVLGAVAYVLAVVAALGLAVVLGALAMSWPLIVPSVVCESVGSGEFGHGDAVDALQRSAAYALNAPVRLGLYGGIGVAQATAAWWVGSLLAAGSVGFARGAVTSWLPGEKAAGLGSSTAGHVMAAAECVPGLLAAACAACVATAAATLAYLLLRRFCDGQDEREVWIPSGAVPAASAETGVDDADDE